MENNTIDFFGQSLHLITGETHRLVNDLGQQTSYYIALAECLGHYILFCYTDMNDDSVNYVSEIIDGIPSFASNYLIDVMQNNNSLLIYITRYIDSDSCYDIYYNFNGDDFSIDGLVNWMQLNNDFAAVNYRYTEIKDGKQTIPG